ncbi:DUF2776 family protein [Uniformispora flossi]|uniref:DUF2776 family protein n=1 Tax=Uniformispora flossi TaxID=3390723 RepID=UPI003C2D1DD7
MNYRISLLFRAIPVVMAGVCLGMGLTVLRHPHPDPDAYVAGHVNVFLTAICLCLFATACTIIRQLLGRYSAADRLAYPILAGLLAAGTFAYGVHLATDPDSPNPHSLAGHVILGLGLICGCVFSVVLASTRFSTIPLNSASAPGSPAAGPSFGATFARLLPFLPFALALTAWTWSIVLLAGGGHGTGVPRSTAGFVLAGIACVCTALIGLVASILRQVQGTYTDTDRRAWPALAAAAGAVSLLWGIGLICHDNPKWATPGLVMAGLGLVCWSILSKVLLLAIVWRRTAELASRVPMIPTLTALSCLFLSTFLFEADTSSVIVAARVLVGLGAICYSLFSIVSILESGTS